MTIEQECDEVLAACDRLSANLKTDTLRDIIEHQPIDLIHIDHFVLLATTGKVADDEQFRYRLFAWQSYRDCVNAILVELSREAGLTTRHRLRRGTLRRGKAGIGHDAPMPAFHLHRPNLPIYQYRHHAQSMPSAAMPS